MKPKLPPHATIASTCGVTLATVRAWSRGARPAPVWALCKIARAFPEVDIVAVVEFWGARWLARNAPE